MRTDGDTTTLVDQRNVVLETTSTAVSPQLRSGLADLIIAKRSSAEVDESGVIVANAAVDDAVKVVQRRDLGGAPRVMFSEDGVLALQWQRDEYGVALIFAGDGMVSIAFRRPGQLYAENGIEVSVSEDLPPEFRDVLAKIEN